MAKIAARRHGIMVLVALLVSIYTLSHSSKFHIVDEVSLFAVTESIGLRGAVDTNTIAWTQWVNSPGEVLGAFGPTGEVYSKKGPTPAVLAVPWYLALRWIAQVFDVTIGLLQGTLLWNGVITAVTAALLWLTAFRLGYGDRVGLGVGLLFGLCTIAWPYANQFFGEPLSALSLLACFYGLLSWRETCQVRWVWMAGIGVGAAVTTVTAHVLLVVVLVAYGGVVTWQLMRVQDYENASVSSARLLHAGIALLLPIVLCGTLLLVYNQIRFGAPFETGYHFDQGEGFTTPFLQGLWGLVVSPYRGVFWFTPLLVASVVGAIPFVRRHLAEGVTIGLLTVVLVGTYSLWWMWWGGFAWGPRFLVPLTPFWVLLLCPLVAEVDVRPVKTVQSDRRLFWRDKLAIPGARGWFLLVTALVSFGVQVLAVSVNFVNYEILLRSIFPTDWEDPLAFGPPAQRLSEMQYMPVLGQVELVRRGLVPNSDLAWLWQDGNIQWLIVLFGAAVVVTLAGILFAYWWGELSGKDEPVSVGVPLRGLVVVLPLLLIAVWLGEVSHNPHFGNPEHGYRAIVSELCTQAEPDDFVVTVAPFAYQIPMNWMGTQCDFGVPIYGYATNSMEHEEAQSALGERITETDRVWLITGGLPANDPENSVERWLSGVAFKAEDRWYDDFRLLDYATPRQIEDAPVLPLSVPLVGPQTSQVMLLAARTPEQVTPGSVLPVELYYQLEAESNFDLRWFVQLLSADGLPVSLLDTGPEDGYSPFSTLPPNQELVERAGLRLPEILQPGEYTLIAGLYNPESANADRLRAPDGSDHVQLARIIVVPEAAEESR